MSDFKYDKDTLLDKTNGGRDVFMHLYPQCEKGGRFVHFKVREEENTASTIIKRMPDGVYYITDFGDDGKGKNCFDHVMERENLDFYEACKWIAAALNIAGEKVQFNSPELEFKPAYKSQKDGDYFFEYHDTISEEHLSVLGPLVTNEVCERFNLKSCKQFTQVKLVKNKDTGKAQLTQIITKATDKYPIFIFDMEDWQKIYQPLNVEKQYRFRYAGNKPKGFLFGIDNLEKEHFNYHPVFDDEEKEEDFEKDNRLPYVFIGAGDRDSLNIASLNYPVVWKNSESEDLSYSDYKKLQEHAKEIIYIGDLDETGVEQTIKLALSYIDIKIGWLPDWIKDTTYRGKPRKDFTDWINLIYDKNNPDKVEYQFKGIINTALPARFWDVVKNSKGKFQKYTFNNEACYRFINYNGYYRFEEEGTKEEYSFIHIEKGIVKRVKPHHLMNFPTEYLKDKRKPIPLVNFVHRSGQLTDKKLAKLKLKEINFKDTGYDHQLLFFKNKIWKVTADDIKEYNYGDLDACVWEDKIIKRDARVAKTKNFEIFKLTDGSYDIKILNKKNHFLNYLINTSRVHWRVCGDAPFKKRIKSIQETDTIKRADLINQIKKEAEEYRENNKFRIDEEGLSDEEIKEQKLHLINKIFSFGYLLHKQKNRAKPWVVFAMDNRISEIADSNGGSGKSLMYDQAVRQILLNNKYVNGRDREAIKDKHKFSGITKHTDYLMFDDLDSHFPFKQFFTEITGEFNVNAKYIDALTISFEDSPKIAMTSNFGLYSADSSTERRILYNVFGDYYHHKSDLDESAYTISDDLGKMLFSQFDQSEWNDFYNVCAEAIQFFLNTDKKIEAPLGNIEKRNSLQTMGDGFKEWADFYFENILDDQIIKNTAFENFKVKTGLRWTANKFKKALKEWCKFYGYEFNPDEVLNSKGYNKHNHQGTTVEFIYIKSNPTNQVKLDKDEELPDDFDPTNGVPF